MNIKIIIFVLFVALLSAGINRFLTNFGYLTEYTSFPESNECTFHSTPHVGPEDLIKIRENIVLTGSNDNVAMWDMEGGLKVTDPGYLFVLYLDTEESKKLEIQNRPENFVFQPHGIEYDYEKDVLLVLNHPYEGKGDRIEEFQLDMSDLNDIKITYVKSYQLPPHLNGVTNNIIQLKNGEFIVTQWLPYPDDLNNSSRNNWKGKLTKYYSLARTYFGDEPTHVHSCVSKGKQSENSNEELECVVIEGTQAAMNNGITWDYVDTVLVANTGSLNIHVFKLDMNAPREKRLIKQTPIDVTRHTDNVSYDVFLKQYTTGGLGKMYEYFKYIGDQIKVHPTYRENVDFWSFVDIIKYDEVSQKYNVENVLMRPDVSRGCASSIQYKDKIYLGSWCDKSVRICPYKGVNTSQAKQITVMEWLSKQFN